MDEELLQKDSQGLPADGISQTPQRVKKSVSKKVNKPAYLEFFAGSGLVASALKPHFEAVWANDICDKKAAVYTANHGRKYFQLGSISDVSGHELPSASLSWASFPCQDLSLAGLNGGIHAKRSGLVWEWLRIMDEMPETPPILVAENVVGLVSADGGNHYRTLHKALRARGYTVGAVLLDAIHWVPQSRPRVFVVAIKDGIKIPRELLADGPQWMHSKAIVNVAKNMDGWVWWNMPPPPPRTQNLSDVIEWDAECTDSISTKRNLSLIPPKHRVKLKAADIFVAPGYKRTRNNAQVLELRFDNVAGCLRTPKGGSSRQFLVLKQGNQLSTRLLTIRETARLMGAPDSYIIPGSYNDGYKAMGDAVALPVARYLAKHLLTRLLGAGR